MAVIVDYCVIFFGGMYQREDQHSNISTYLYNTVIIMCESREMVDDRKHTCDLVGGGQSSDGRFALH